MKVRSILSPLASVLGAAACRPSTIGCEQTARHHAFGHAWEKGPPLLAVEDVFVSVQLN